MQYGTLDGTNAFVAALATFVKFAPADDAATFGAQLEKWLVIRGHFARETAFVDSIFHDVCDPMQDSVAGAVATASHDGFTIGGLETVIVLAVSGGKDFKFGLSHVVR